MLLVNFSSVRYFAYMDLLRKLLKRWLPGLDGDAASLLCSGAESVLSAEMGMEIWALARTAKSQHVVRRHLETNKPDQVLRVLKDEPAAADFLNRFDAFLEKFGHRGL